MIKAVTFNIRCDHEQDGSNSFCFRKDGIIKKIHKEQPDLICFQEVLPHVAAWLRETFPEYDMIGCGRTATCEDEQETIAYRRNRFHLIAMETFWLSPTPNIPGSRHEEQSIWPRVAAEAVFHDLQEKMLLRTWKAAKQ